MPSSRPTAMAHRLINRMANWIFVVLLCTQNGYTHAGPATTRSYLPPIPGVSDRADSVQQGPSIVETQQQASYPSSYTATTYNTNHISPDTFQTSPQLSNHKSVSSYTRTYYNSYVPQPSGVGKHLPQPPTPAPLPSLIPKSVLDQFASAAKSTFPSSSIGNSIDSRSSAQSSNRATTPVQDSLSLPVPTLPASSSPPAVALGLGGSESSQPPTNAPSQSFIMFDSPPSLLTPSQNETIYAAKLLATSLLQATGDGPIDKLDGFNVVDANNIKENDLNSRDVVIVKSQKNAYLIPMQLPTGEKKPMAIEELYNMRDKLNKAYTINQFIFIIKPERINFLNKLV